MQVLLTVPSRTGEGGKDEDEDEEGGGDAGVQMKNPPPICMFLQGSMEKKKKKDNNICLRKSLPKFHTYILWQFEIPVKLSMIQLPN